MEASAKMVMAMAITIVKVALTDESRVAWIARVIALCHKASMASKTLQRAQETAHGRLTHFCYAIPARIQGVHICRIGSGFVKNVWNGLESVSAIPVPVNWVC
jgi:hypothetical protein